MDNILEAYKKNYIGKRFIYKSKYGVTLGTIENMSFHCECYPYEEEDKILLGNHIKFTVLSNRGVHYDLEEIFVIL